MIDYIRRGVGVSDPPYFYPKCAATYRSSLSSAVSTRFFLFQTTENKKLTKTKQSGVGAAAAAAVFNLSRSNVPILDLSAAMHDKAKHEQIALADGIFAQFLQKKFLERGTLLQIFQQGDGILYFV